VIVWKSSPTWLASPPPRSHAAGHLLLLVSLIIYATSSSATAVRHPDEVRRLVTRSCPVAPPGLDCATSTRMVACRPTVTCRLMNPSCRAVVLLANDLLMSRTTAPNVDSFAVEKTLRASLRCLLQAVKTSHAKHGNDLSVL